MVIKLVPDVLQRLPLTLQVMCFNIHHCLVLDFFWGETCTVSWVFCKERSVGILVRYISSGQESPMLCVFSFWKIEMCLYRVFYFTLWLFFRLSQAHKSIPICFLLIISRSQRYSNLSSADYLKVTNVFQSVFCRLSQDLKSIPICILQIISRS